MALARLVRASGEYIQIPYLRYGVSQTLSVAGGSTPVSVSSTAITCGSGVVIQPSVNVRYKVSFAGSAATPNDPLAWAGKDTYIGMPSGYKISCIKNLGEPDGEVVVTPFEEG